LHAATAATSLYAATMTVESVNVETRTVSGLLIPYGDEIGLTSAGPVVVPEAGRIALPTPDLFHRVKLVDEHQSPPRSVGYAVALADRPQGLRGEFRIVSTPDGDRVLAEMTPDADGGRARDGFSVELVNITLADSPLGGGVGELVTGQLSAVAAVTTPAWASAREDGLAAAQSETTNGRNSMSEEQRARLAELLANASRTDEESTELRELLELAGGEAGMTCQPDQPEDQAEAQAGTATPPAQLAASVPGSLPSRGSQQRRPQRDIRELYAATARVLSGRSRAELEAALLDVTSTANIWVAGSEYDGQLWSGLEYQRRWVPLMTPGELRSYKGTGWRWTTKPEVADYAGDKAAVPSNQPVTEEAAWTAARLAGAHDLDRKFFDFGDQEFIEAYYAAMRESYARQSDAKARAFLIANAKTAGAAGVGMFRAAAVAAQAVDDATGGATVDYFLVNSADRLALLDMTESEIPAYLEAFGVTPDKFIPTPGVPSLTVIAGNKASSKFRELPGSPIRVEAINIANGGVDGGVFGYYATNELVDGGISSATFTAA
jgi:hypothetical protein